ncbi:MAG: hypothetical protein IMW98_10200 [Firmicutes bacterium]|nr:hypothetical protein [Bacillota bacterium]
MAIRPPSGPAWDPTRDLAGAAAVPPPREAPALSAAREALAQHLARLPVIVGVSYDPNMGRPVIVVREVSTGRVVAQIPPDTATARLSDWEREVRRALAEGKDETRG